MSYYSGVAGAKAARWIQLNQIKNGTVPLLNPKELQTLPEKPAEPGVRFSPYISFVFIILFLVFMLGLPVLFYLLQQAWYSTPQTLLFENITPAVLSFFPGIGVAYMLTTLLYMIIRGIWPQVDTISAYHSIITANRFYWNTTSKKIPWERGITKKHVEKVIHATNRTNSIAVVVSLLICLPLYYMLFTSYRHITTDTWTESTVGNRREYSLSAIERVHTSLTLTEETDDGETELQPHMDIEVYIKGENSPMELCTPACYYTQQGVKRLIFELKKGDTVFTKTPIKTYQREFIEQQNNSVYLLEIYDAASE